jgi:two-component system chemotaxis response regulator CheB
MMKGENGQPEDNAAQRIIVIGASSGGFDAMRRIVAALPADFDIPIFIVWHMSPDVSGILPQVLNRQKKITAAHAQDGEPIKPNRIYVAPPDHHLLVMQGVVRVTHGPKENLFRPAIDPLFRSAAFSYGNRVIGVILSGGLDDGTAGLGTVKNYGGVAIVQDPTDAEMPSMPESALREVKVDYCLPVSDIADVLVRLSKMQVKKADIVRDEQTRKEIDIAGEARPMAHGELEFTELTPYTCPECHGVLSRLYNDKSVRYRCHTGHAYSTETLMNAISEKIENSLYSAIRAFDEIVILMNHIGDHHAELNNPGLAAVYFQKAKEADKRSQLVWKALRSSEQLSKEELDQEPFSIERKSKKVNDGKEKKNNR